MKKQFLSKSVPRGTRTIWRYLGALFLIFTFAIGNVWANSSVSHTFSSGDVFTNSKITVNTDVYLTKRAGHTSSLFNGNNFYIGNNDNYICVNVTEGNVIDSIKVTTYTAGSEVASGKAFSYGESTSDFSTSEKAGAFTYKAKIAFGNTTKLTGSGNLLGTAKVVPAISNCKSMVIGRKIGGTGDGVTFAVGRIEVFYTSSSGSSDVCPSGMTISGTTDYYVGEKITLNAALSEGNGTITYQWYKGSVAPANAISGATSAKYEKASCTLDDAGDYYCVASKTSCDDAVNTSAYTVTVSEPKTINDLVTIAADYTFTPSATIAQGKMAEGDRFFAANGECDYTNGMRVKENRALAFKVNNGAKVKVTFTTNSDREMQLGTAASDDDNKAYGHSATSPAEFTVTAAGVVYLTASSDLRFSKLEITYPVPACAATVPGDISKGELTAGKITLTAEGSAASGDTWYWQSSATGTSTAAADAYDAVNGKEVSAAGTYYLRSYNTAGECWSAAKSIELVAADFLAEPTVTFDDGAYVTGATALNLSGLFSSNSDGAVTYALKEATDDATITGYNFTATVAGSYVVVATQAATASFSSATKEATVVVTYPATGAATVTYKIAVGTSQTTLGTASKQANSSSITGLSDFAFAGDLSVLSGGGKDVSSPKIANPTAKDEGKYLYFTFNVADGYEFTISSVTTKVVAVSNAKTIEVALSDTEGTSESLSYDQGKNNEPTEHVFNFAGKAYSGTVTLKVYAYAATEEGYRLGQPLTISGTVAAAAQMYTVSFAKGGADGSEVMAAAEYKAGASVTVPDCDFTYTDHIFDGWEVKDAENNTLTVTEGKFTMPASNVTLTATWREDVGEARIGETNYPTLAEALAHAADGEIVLLKDVDVTAQIEISANTILDLNGHTIEYVGDATLPSGVILVHNGASLTINDSSNPDAGSIVSGDKAYAAVALTKLGDDASTPATLVVNGGALTGYYYGITGNGSRNNTVITINGGTIIGTVGIAIYHPQVGTLTVNNGNLTGVDAAIEMRAGTLVINDGTFTATATEFSCNPNGSGSTTTGAAIAIAQHTTKKEISVTINGGTFNGVKALNESNPQVNDPAPAVTMAVTNGEFNGEVTTVDVNNFISGGKFSEVVAVENCAEGFVPVTEKDANNQYAVTPGCKIYLNTNGGNEIAATFAATGANMPSVESPVKAGYVFKGWFAEAGLENAYVPGAEVTSEADVTLYAKWEAAEPNHYVYAYNDAFHYDGVTYLTPRGKVDNAAGDNKGIAYTLFEGEEGITSVVLSNGSYDCKTGALQAITSHLKLKNDASSKLTVTIKSGYTATLKIKAAGYGGARNYAVSNAEPAVATTEGKLVNDNAMNLSSLVEQTFALEAGVHEITADGGTLYISEMDIEAAEVTVDLTLKDLKVGGTSIEGFAASTTRYEYNLAYGEAYPEVTYVLNDVVNPELVEVAVVQLAARIDIDQSALVKVTEKANTENFKQYQVHFNIAAKEGVCLVKGNVTDNAITRDAEASYLKAEQVTLANSKVSGRDEEGDTGSKFQKKSYLKIELPEGESFQVGDIVDLEVSKIGGTYKLLVYAAYDGGETVETGENLLVNAETAPTLAVGHNKVALTKASRTLYLARDNSNSWNPHVLSVSVQRYMDPFIESFEIEGIGALDINPTTKAITASVPESFDVTALTPTIKAWANGSAHLDKSGAQNFTNPVTYKVTSDYAEDGEVTYTVTITKVAPSATPTITTQPVSANYVEGASINALTVVAESTAGELSYQWQVKNGLEFEDIDGATAASYTPTVSAIGSYIYRVVVTNTEESKPATSVESEDATIVIAADPSCATFVGEIADPTYEYTNSGVWTIYNASSSGKYNESHVFDTGKNFENENANVYKKERCVMIFEKDMKQVRFYSTGNTRDWATENAVQVSEDKANFLAKQSLTYSTMAATTSMDNSYAADGKSCVLIANGDFEAGKVYWFAFNGTLQVSRICAVEADPKAEAPVFSGTLSDEAICSGNSFATLDATASPVTSYAWYKDDEVIAGATAATYTPTEAGTYYCIATNAQAGHRPNSLKSAEAVLSVKEAASVTMANVSGKATASIALNAVATGANPHYAWFTCDDAEGNNAVAIPGAADAASYAIPTPVATQYYKVVVTTDCGNASAVALVTLLPDIVPLADVTENTVWDWTEITARADGSAIDEVIDDKNHGPRVATANGLVLANYVLGGGYWDKIEGNNNAYVIRNTSNVYYQGASLHMHTTKGGILKINARNDGNAMKMKIGSAEFALTNIFTDYVVYVPAGDVTIENVPETAGKPMRVKKITFTVKESPDYTRDEMLGAGVYGTICLPNNVPAGAAFGATFYEIAGREPQYGKIAFDEVTELKAGIPYVFQAHGDVINIFYGENHVDDPATEDTHGMYGTFTATTLTELEGVYYFANRALWSCVDLTELILPANRAYVKLSEVGYLEPNNAPAPGRRRVTMGVNGPDQVPTAIDNAEASEAPRKVMINGELFIIRGEKMYDGTGRLVK